MNKKQKVLTVIALIAFVVIAAGHYLAVETYQDYSRGRKVEVTIHPTPPPPNYPSIDKFANIDDWLAATSHIPTPTAPPPFTEQQSVPDIRVYPAWVDPTRSLIPDVRMPWFVLGVIYAGLFFLLADRKEKR